MAPPPPPAPAPPPMEDLDSFLSNGIDGQPQNEGAVALPSFEAGDTNGPMDTAPPAPPEKEPQPWEKPLSIPDIRKSSNNWSLASDAGLLLYLQEFSHKMLAKTSDLEKKVDGLVHETKCTDSRVHNVFNDFLMLANTQFIENRVYDDSEETDQKPDAGNNKKEDQAKTREQREAEVIPRVMKALNLGIDVLDSAFEQLDANVGNSDSEEEDATYRAVVDPILEPKDLYAHRSLPFLIGSPAFMQDDNVGVAEITEEEMSEEGSVSGSEKTTSESESEYTDESETESEVESDVATKKKPAQLDRSQSESENDLFEGEKSSDDEEDEKPKGGAFASELAARIGAAPPSKPDDEETKRDRTISEVSGTSTSSKGKKRKKGTGKDKAGKRRSASKASAASGENMFDEAAAGGDEDEDSPFGKKGGLFSSSGGGLFGDDKDEDEGGLFDEEPKPRSASRREDHIYEDISADDLDEHTTKSGRKVPAGAVPIFGDPSTEEDLFGSSPKSNEAGESSRKKKQGEVKSSKASEAKGGGGGLFDDDDDGGGLFASPAASKPLKKEAAKKSVDLFDDDGEGDLFSGGSTEKPPATAAAPRQRADSKKKLPAGAVSMFGTLDPLAAKRASGDHEEEEEKKATPPPVAKKEPKAKPEQKASMFDGEDGEEGDLFAQNSKSKPAPAKTPTKTSLFADSDGDDDALFAGKESIHVPPAAKTAATSKPEMKKKATSGSLFDDIEGDDEDDLFGASSKPKETTKKKPAGGVALFGDADMFSTSPKKEEPVESATVTKRDKTPKSRTTLSLFDDDEQDDQLFGDTALPEQDEVVTRHRTKSKSVFDDEDVLFNVKEEAPPVDLFGSTSPVSATKPDTNLDKPHSASSASKNLFSDEDEDDLFAAAAKATPKPAAKAKPAKKAESAPPTKPRASSKVDLFGDDDEDGEDLFGGGVKAKAKPGAPEVKAKASTPEVKSKPATPKSAPPEVKAKPDKEKKDVDTSDGPARSDPLFGEQSPPPAAKPKKPAGAVSMFGGFDPSAITGQISGSIKEEEKEEEKEEKVEDKRGRTPSTSSVSENISPKPFMAAASHDKPASVIRSVRAPLAKAGGKRISMLQSNITIDPTAMRPGATPPSREVEPEGVSFDEPPKLQTLSSLNKGRAKVSTKRRAPSRRFRTEGATTAVSAVGSSPTFGGSAGSFSTSPGPLPEEQSQASGLPDFSGGTVDTGDALFPPISSSKPKEKDIPSSNFADFSSPLDFAPSGITLPPTSSVDKPKTSSSDISGNDDLFGKGPAPTVAAPLTTEVDDDNLFVASPKKTEKNVSNPLGVDEDLLSSKTQAKEKKSDPFGSDLFGESPQSKKPGKKAGKTKAPAQDDDLFASTPKKKETKPSSAPLLDEDEDLFASPSTKTKKKKETKKVELDDDDDLFAPKKTTAKKTKSKKPDSDLFGDSTNIFDDIPSAKPKEKKKKKESALFADPTEGDIFASPTSSKTKKTKTKKKAAEKKPAASDSIFDESAPSIFDDPLNAMGK